MAIQEFTKPRKFNQFFNSVDRTPYSRDLAPYDYYLKSHHTQIKRVRNLLQENWRPFWGILLTEYMPRRTTINAETYGNTLIKLRSAILEKLPHFLQAEVLLLHDNARIDEAWKILPILEKRNESQLSTICKLSVQKPKKPK